MGKAVIRKSRQWSAVPDAVFELPISTAARLTLAWAFGRPDGWEFHISHLQKTLDLSDSAWRRIRKELIEAGFFSQHRTYKGYKTVEWLNVFTDDPLYASKSR